MNSQRDMSSSPVTKTEEELVLSVANLEDNYHKVKSYEAMIEELKKSNDQRRLSQLSQHFPDEDDIPVPRGSNKIRLIPYHLPLWSGQYLFHFF